MGGTLLGSGLALVLVLVGFTLIHRTPDVSGPGPVAAVWARPAVSAGSLPDHLGARLTSVAVTGGGGLIDVRFQVLDPDLAAAIHDRSTPPAVVEERTGLFLDQLLMGHSHSGPFRQSESYYLLFVNTGNWVHRGDEVALLLGGVQVEHVKVS